MRTIALMTDFGSNDNFVGVMKAVLFKVNPYINIVDISHDIPPQDIFKAAFLLKSSYRYFPKKTIFLVVVDPGVGSKRKPLIIQSRDYFFVGPDNGVLSLAADEDGIKKIVVIENKKYFLQPQSSTFHGRDIFAPVAGHISCGKDIGLFGRPLNSIKKLYLHQPEEKRNILRGKIIYIDRFGNLITNIDKNIFQRFTQNKKFKIKIKNRQLYSIVKSYQAVKPGKLLAIFGSFGFLEIALNGGSALKYLKAKIGTIVSIE